MTQATKNKLINALERLLEGKPENRELRKKAREGKLKINNSTVEKEAGLSVGALRNHPDIKDLIQKKSLSARVNKCMSAQSEVELLLEEIKKQKSENTQANKKKKEYLDLARSHEQALATQAANHIKMIQELMEMLPASEREKAMDKVVNTRPDNIVEGNFRK
ncbi:bacterioferritin comigratory protein [Vibrio sp. 10N.261.46.A3]|uniref:bacterioferritin comigratory protein n=1 Tax=Vibrio sp. 10N.261.46.A3 TaxID=3229658 RepID=UPI00354EECF9